MSITTESEVFDPGQRVIAGFSDLVNRDYPEVGEYKEFFSRWDEYEDDDLPKSETTIVQITARATVRFLKIGIILEVLMFLADLGRSFLKNGGFQPDFFLDLQWQLMLVAVSGLMSIASFYRDKHSKPVIRTVRGDEVKHLWLGSGQIQFGCGSKGISVENPDRFTYFLRWAKVSDVYDDEDPDRDIDRTNLHNVSEEQTVQKSDWQETLSKNQLLNAQKKANILIRLGSRLNQSQNLTRTARATADRKFLASLS